MEATVPPQPARAPLGFDLDVDVCVVGAGLAGLTAALEIARRGWSVAVLEARRIGSAASGRNTGFVHPGYAESIDMIVDRVGPDHARALWVLSADGVAYVRDAIAGFAAAAGQDDVTLGQGWLSVSRSASGVDIAAKAARHAALGATLAHWPAEQVRALLCSPHYGDAVYFPDAFHIDPLRYTLALAAAAEQAGAQIFENTAALSFDPAGVRKRIVTPAGRVRAAHVVVAGNVGLGGLMPRLGATLIPITAYVATTQPLGAALAEAVRFAGAVSDSDGADSHYRIVDGDRLMWSGGLTTWRANPQGYRRRLAADISRTFPQLKTVAFEHLWAGTMGVPVHKMPQLGQLYPGVWVASGFAGHGLNTTAMAGDLIAQAVTGEDDRWRLFAPYNLAWAGGTAGRAIVQAAYWAKRIRQRTGAFLVQPVARAADSPAPADGTDGADARARGPSDSRLFVSVADVPRTQQTKKPAPKKREPAGGKTKQPQFARKMATSRKKADAGAEIATFGSVENDEKSSV